MTSRLALTVLGLCVFASGQKIPRNNLDVTVVDEVGAVISNANIIAVNRESGEIFQGKSSQDGKLNLVLPIGDYQILGTARCFFNQTRIKGPKRDHQKFEFKLRISCEMT